MNRHRAVERLLFLVVIAAWCAPTIAQEDGNIGEGHEKWHGSYYSTLQRPDGRGYCCNLWDCRPTSVRTMGDHYEVKKDGRWLSVPADKVIKKGAPDGGAHICAPPSDSKAYTADEIFCVVLPNEI